MDWFWLVLAAETAHSAGTTHMAEPSAEATRIVSTVVGVMSTLGGAIVGSVVSVLFWQASRNRASGLGVGVASGAVTGAVVGLLLGASMHDVGPSLGALVGVFAGALGGLVGGLMATRGEVST